MSDVLARRQFVGERMWGGRVERFTVTLHESGEPGMFHGVYWMTVVMASHLRPADSDLFDDPREVDVSGIRAEKAVLLQPQDMHRIKLLPDERVKYGWKLQLLEPLDLFGEDHHWTCELLNARWRNTHSNYITWYPGRIVTRRRRHLNSLLMTEKL